MKKLIIALSLGLLFTASAYAAIPGDPTLPGVFMRVKGASQDSAIPVYRLVRNSSRDANQQQFSKDCAVVWDTNSSDGITVRLTTTSADPAFAGIVVSNIPTADNASTQASDDNGRRNWGYIVVSGFTTAQAGAGGLNGASSAGSFFVTSGDAGKITVPIATSHLTDNQAALAAGAGGIVLVAGDGTTTSYKVYVKAQ